MFWGVICFGAVFVWGLRKVMGWDRKASNDSRQKSGGFEKKREGTVPIFSFSVYLAWNLTHYRLFLCPPFFLDSIFCRSGAGWGLDSVWTQLAALTPPLPLGLADYVLHYITGECENQPLGTELSAAVKQVPPGIKASGWRYLGWWLRRWRPGTGEAGAGENAAGSAGPGQMSPAVERLLRERRQLARQVLLSLEAKALPPGLILEAEGFLRQLGPVKFLAGEPETAGPLNLGDSADALKDAAEPASPSNSTNSIPICSSSVTLANSMDSATGLEAELELELLWLERFLAGRALLPKEVQTLLAENQDQLPAALRDSGYRFRNGDTREASTGPGGSGASGAGVWVPARIQAAFQVLALQGRALLRPAVGRDLRGQSLCYRCGQSDQLKSAVCGHCGRQACYYCESCNSLGLARECLPLYLVPGVKPASGKPGPADQETEREAAAEFPAAKTGNPLVANEAELDPGQVFKSKPVPVQLDFPLTPAQQRAAEKVRQFAAASPLKQCLVWAVCGAGKTEVVFPALAEALARGGPVLYATPRREVVQELAPRLKQAFPSFRVSQLYAGSGERFALADIYAATTHQTLRFYQNFDLVVLDEVDAYPYRDNPLLHYAVLRASRPGGKIIYLTATPSAVMQQQAQARDGRELAVVYIPARHHGFPVPEPELIGESGLRWPSGEPNLNRRQNQDRNRVQNQNQKQKLELPGSVVDLIQRAVAEQPEQPGRHQPEQSQLLIFVPAVRLAGLVAEAVSRQVEFDQLKWSKKLTESAEPAESERRIKLERREEPIKQIKAVKQVERPALPWVQASHAGDPRREQKRQAFSQGDFPILVTTTILERGITIPRVNVLVLFADAEKIFDEGSLVQMAGRVGRTAAYPQGKVWLVGSRISPAMRLAQARIREMNRRARALGYLHEGRGEAGQDAE